MCQIKNAIIGLAMLAFTGIAFVADQSLAADFIYPNFDSTAGLILQGAASLVTGIFTPDTGQGRYQAAAHGMDSAR